MNVRICKNRTSYVLRMLSLLAAMLFVFQLFALNAFAADEKCGSDLTWSFENGVLTIEGSGAMTDFTEGTFAPWYENADEIRSVVLPDGLTHIGTLAFYNCTELTHISMPDSVVSIGNHAFYGCTSLLTVKLSQKLESIGTSAFRECVNLSAVRFPDTLKTISDMAFYRCYAISVLYIPASVTSVGTQAFTYCTGLVRATIAASITVLPPWTFYGCEKLTDVILSESITAVDEYSMQSCPRLNSVYSENHDVAASDALMQSISDSNPDMAMRSFMSNNSPDGTSKSTVDNGSAVVSTQVKDTGDSVITVTDTAGYTDNGFTGDTKTDIDAVIDNEDGWSDLIDTVNQKLEEDESSRLSVSIAADGNTVNGDKLSSLAGKNVDVTITTSDGTVWQIDASKASAGDLKGNIDLSVSVSVADHEKIKVGSDEVYSLKFAGSTAFKSTVGVKLGSNTAYQTATLYQKKAFGGYTKIQSVKVDDDGRAWFMLANIDKGTDYYIAINGEDVSDDEVLIPATLNSSYGLPDGPVLLGVDGTEYAITGKKSSWGVDLKTVMIITIAAMVAAGGIIGLVMVLINRGKQAKMKLTSVGESAELDEDAVYMDVLRELEGDGDEKKKKKAPKTEKMGKEKKAPRSEEKKKK